MTSFLLFLRRLLDMVLLPFTWKSCVINLEDNQNLMIGYAAFGYTREMIATTSNDIMQSRAASAESTETTTSKANKEDAAEKNDDEKSPATESDTTIQPDPNLGTDWEIVTRLSEEFMMDLGGEIDENANVTRSKIISGSLKTDDETHKGSFSSDSKNLKDRPDTSGSDGATLDNTELLLAKALAGMRFGDAHTEDSKEDETAKESKLPQNITADGTPQTERTKATISSAGPIGFASQATKAGKKEENPTICRKKPPLVPPKTISKPPLTPKTLTSTAKEHPHKKTATTTTSMAIPVALTNTKTHQDVDTLDSVSKPSADEKLFKPRLQKIEVLCSELQNRLDLNFARHMQAQEWSGDSSEDGAAHNARNPVAAPSSPAVVPLDAATPTTKELVSDDKEPPRTFCIEKQIQDDEAMARAIEKAERDELAPRNITSTEDNAQASGTAVASWCSDFDAKLPAVDHEHQQQLHDDEAIAKVLQMEEDYLNEEATRIAVSNEACDAMMAATATGKAWRFVESITSFVASSSNKSGFQAVATDDLVFMAQRMFEAQENFLNNGVPTEVDIGYHYTNEANMSKIQTEGLMTRPERQKNKIEADRFNGATYGEGIYTGDDPARFSGYGNVGLVVARLKGIVMDASKAQKGYHHGNHSITQTFSARAALSDPSRLVVLQYSNQCVAIVRYPTMMREDRYFGETVSHIKALVDETFNYGDMDSRQKDNLARKLIDELAFDSGDFHFQQPDNSFGKKHTFNPRSAIGAFAHRHTPFPFGAGNNNNSRPQSIAVPGSAQTTPTPVAPAALKKAPPNSGHAPPTAFPQVGNATAAAAVTAATAKQNALMPNIFSNIFRKNRDPPRVQACNLVTSRGSGAEVPAVNDNTFLGAKRVASKSSNIHHCWGLTGTTSQLMYHPSSTLPHSVQYIAGLVPWTSSRNVLEGMYTNRFDSECAICLCSMQDCCVGTLKCGHQFHLQCIREAEKTTTQCPICRMLFAEPVGSMPNGTMNITFFSSISCRGISGSIIQIDYDIPSGVQSSNHANPGEKFKGANRTAYIPDTREGRRLLTRLVYAFSHGLTFTVGTSLTSGQSNVVTWGTIHHKTNLSGGVHGYPDPNYFRNVLSELDALGVPDAEI